MSPGRPGTDDSKSVSYAAKEHIFRALARDIGEALHSGAHLTGLIRTRVGDVRLEDCLNPEHFKEWIDGQEIENEEENN